MWMSVQGHCQRMASQVHDYLETLPPGLANHVVVGVVVGGAVLYLTVRYLRYRHSQSVVWERGQEAARAIQSLTNHLMQEEQAEGPADRQKEAKIVSLTLRQLREKLRNGDLTAKEVLRAFQRKALEVNEKLNCVTEPIFEAEALAVERDLCEPNQRGPLHGVPISVKDSFFLEGYDCHAGLSAFVDQPKDQDAHLVELMKKLGAIPFVRTNFPQGLMTYACSNPMYGQTCNPHNTSRGPGGSSGGEGALIGGGGSVVGLGSDIGGSIRIPCQMCGVYGLKPTVDRIVNKGTVPLGDGQSLVRVTGGLMTRDMDSLLLLSEETFTPIMHQLDPAVPPLSFRDELFSSKGPLRVGVYTTIEGIMPHPACVRAVNEAKAALQRRGYKVVEFKPPRPVDAMCNLFMKACFGDAGEETHFYMKDDVLDYSVRFSHYAEGLPYWIKVVVGHLIKLADPVFGRMVLGAASVPKKILDWWRLEENIQAYKAEFLEAWRKQKLDAVICPGLPFPAVTLGQEDNTLAGVVYMTLYNLLNYPAGIMPVTTINEEDLRQLRDPAVFPQNTSFAKFLVKDSKGSEGLPVSVQCVGLPFHEELVLRVMTDIDTTLKQ